MAAIELTGLARAQIVGTFSGTGTAEDTITLGGLAYTLKDSTTTGAREVKIGADAATTCTNFCLAVNAGPSGSGTLWGSTTTASPYVTAVDNRDATVTLLAKAPGLIGNAVVIAESGTGFSFAGAATRLADGTGAFQTLLLASLNTIYNTHQLNAETLGMLGRIITDIGS